MIAIALRDTDPLSATTYFLVCDLDRDAPVWVEKEHHEPEGGLAGRLSGVTTP